VPADWLLAGQLQKMVMVVTSCVSKKVLERWTFDILTDPTALAAQCVVRLSAHAWHDGQSKHSGPQLQHATRVPCSCSSVPCQNASGEAWQLSSQASAHMFCV